MKIFYKKKDALQYLFKSNNNDLQLFQEDVNDKGSKRFLIALGEEIYEMIHKKKNKSYYYESWNKNDNMYFSLDIDINIEKKRINVDDIIYNNINSVIYYYKKFYKFTLNANDIIVLKTDKQPGKYSVHIIFKGISFENHLVCKNFYERMIKDTKNKLRYTDKSIYNLTCLRTCYSTKKGKKFPLYPYKFKYNGEYTAHENEFSNLKDFFMNTLITNVNENDKCILKKNMVKLNYENYDFKNIVNKCDVNNDEIVKILNYIPFEYCKNFKFWNKIGMILFSINVNNFEIFDNWSKKCPKKYNNIKNQEIWNNYNNPNFNRNIFTLMHLKYLAKDGGYKFDKESMEFIVNNYPQKPIELNDSEIYKVENINYEKLNPKLFNDIIHHKLIAIQSEKGTGKTSNLLPVLFKNNFFKKKILFLSSRRTFGIKLAADLKKYGIELYSNIEQYNIFNEKIICQIDSLLRLQINKFDIIIVDECESLARYMGSSHFTKNPKSSYIISEFEERIHSCDKLILMDADLSDRCMNYYTALLSDKLKPIDIKVIRNIFTPYETYTLNYLKYTSWLNKLIEFIKKNKKIAIPMASNNKAKDLFTLLQNYFPNKKIKLIHKETKDEEKLRELLNVNSSWVNYDIVIYTPTVCMGVSFDITHFDHIFGYGCHNSLGAQEFCQMIHRIRNPKNNNIYIAMDFYKFYNDNDKINYTDVEIMMCNDYYLTKYNLHENILQKKIKREDTNRVLFYPHKDEPIYDLLVRNNIEKINDQNNFSASFFGYVKFKKYKISFYDFEKDSQILTDLKTLQEERKLFEDNKEIDNLFNATLLTDEQYKEKITRKEQFLEEEDVNEINKYKFVKIYYLENENITKELISQYKDKKKN